MIVFNLLTLNPAHAQAAARLMLTEHLATNVFLDEAVGNLGLLADGTVGTEPLYRVIFLTKALLCRPIEELLQTQFPDNDFRIYGTPVTHVNEAEAELVRQLRAV